MVNESLTKHGIFITFETNLLEMREVKTAKIKGVGSGQDTGDDPEADTHTDAVMSDNKNSIQYNSASSRTKTSASYACSDYGAFISQKVA